MRCLIVSHTHWDREWYRTFEAFRARLVDAVDRVLDLLAADPGASFLLDGQTIVVEDYLAIRPERREELVAAARAGRLAVGPWYVQPDSLLPAGESHVRNLLEGARVARDLGVEPSRVAYTPDSFGHPAQFPQLFAGFGLGPFVYWRGNGVEIDHLGPRWRWRGPDGSVLPAFHLAEGYSVAGEAGRDPQRGATVVSELVERLGRPAGGLAVLMDGADHLPPDEGVGTLAALLAERGVEVARGLLDELPTLLGSPDDWPEHAGELVGARVANLLPGVWSARSWIKVRNHRAESQLTGWAEPFAALGAALGVADERPGLRLAWRALLANQAHDSICGCSIDAVHEQMTARFDTAEELASETVDRVLGRLAGAAPARETPWSDALDLAVFNPSPHPRGGVVRFPLDGYPLYSMSAVGRGLHPLAMASLEHAGFTADGRPARLVPGDPGRVALAPEGPPTDVEIVVDEIPAFAWRRVHLAPGPGAPDEVDDGRSIGTDDVGVTAAPDGTLTVTLGERTWTGLLGVEDLGDRGDTYDFDPVPDDVAITAPVAVAVERRRHVSGIGVLSVERTFAVPAGLTPDRRARRSETVPLRVRVDAKVVPGVRRVDLVLEVDDPAEDHRLRLSFPTGGPLESVEASTTFDRVRRRPGPDPDADRWIHPPPPTFAHHGWLAASGLGIVAPGLAEAEARPDGTIMVTALRCVGWLARGGLATRPVPAGPGPATPGAQCPGVSTFALALADAADAAAARDHGLGLRAVPAGDRPLVPERASLLQVSPPEVELSACLPASDGDGFVVRLLNPTDAPIRASVGLWCVPISVEAVRLDESALGRSIEVDDATFSVDLAPHALGSYRVSVPG